MLRSLITIAGLGIALGSMGYTPEAQAAPEGQLAALEGRSVRDDYGQFFSGADPETLTYSGTAFEGIYEREEDFLLTEDLEATFGDTLERDTIFEIDPDSEVNNKIKLEYDLYDLSE
jgi:hypothetical protein